MKPEEFGKYLRYPETFVKVKDDYWNRLILWYVNMVSKYVDKKEYFMMIVIIIRKVVAENWEYSSFPFHHLHPQYPFAYEIGEIARKMGTKPKELVEPLVYEDVCENVYSGSPLNILMLLITDKLTRTNSVESVERTVEPVGRTLESVGRTVDVLYRTVVKEQNVLEVCKKNNIKPIVSLLMTHFRSLLSLKKINLIEFDNMIEKDFHYNDTKGLEMINLIDILEAVWKCCHFMEFNSRGPLFDSIVRCSLNIRNNRDVLAYVLLFWYEYICSTNQKYINSVLHSLELKGIVHNDFIVNYKLYANNVMKMLDKKKFYHPLILNENFMVVGDSSIYSSLDQYDKKFISKIIHTLQDDYPVNVSLKIF